MSKNERGVLITSAVLFGIFLVIQLAFSQSVLELYAVNEKGEIIAPLSASFFLSGSLSDRNVPFSTLSSKNGTIFLETNRSKVFYYISSDGYSMETSGYLQAPISPNASTKVRAKMVEITASYEATIKDLVTRGPIENALFEIYDVDGKIIYSEKSNNLGKAKYSRRGILLNATIYVTHPGYYTQNRTLKFVQSSQSTSSFYLNPVNGSNVSAAIPAINGSTYPKNSSEAEAADLRRSVSEQTKIIERFPIKGNLTDKSQYSRNTVSIAAYGLTLLGNHSGYLGSSVKDIAREFNNSLERTFSYERKISERSAFLKFFAGGDDATAKKIDESVSENKVLLEKLRALHANCNCSFGAKVFLNTQILLIDADQKRLTSLAEEERKKKGALSWFWK